MERSLSAFGSDTTGGTVALSERSLPLTRVLGVWRRPVEACRLTILRNHPPIS